MTLPPEVSNVLLAACEVIEKQAAEKREILEREDIFSEKLASIVDSLSEKGIVSPEKRAYLVSQIGKDNLTVLDILEKSASRAAEDSSLGSPSTTFDARGSNVDKITAFAMS